MTIKAYILMFICGIIIINVAAAQQKKLSDEQATVETVNLYKNLEKLMDKGIMFGHHETLSYGVEWKKANRKRSDIHDVVNDFPSLFGWDIGHIERKSKTNIDGIPFTEMTADIKWVYDNGGINTISWHMNNPVTLGRSWDKTKAVNAVLPGGVKNTDYNVWLDRAAYYLKSLKGNDGKLIPIIFRPYHELNGGWFWWGKDSTSTKEFVDLFRYTVDYLKNKKQVHNLIYAFNTNTFETATEYMERYPGDDVVDIMSFDNYQFASPTATDSVMKAAKAKYQEQIKNGLSIMDSLAKAHNKIPAFAETGLEAVPDKTWWTGTLWEILKDYKIAYVMLWRNAGWSEKEQKFHYYAPYLGQASAPDFKTFYNLDRTLFKSDVAKENPYQ
jgi:mannan endo-1,4-beta-mannosidase